ncbi:unnamed protein product [Rhodiola kirilowii]
MRWFMVMDACHCLWLLYMLLGDSKTACWQRRKEGVDQVTYGSNYIHMMCLMVPGVGNNQLNNDLYHPNLAHRPNKDQKWDYYTLATHEDKKMAP